MALLELFFPGFRISGRVENSGNGDLGLLLFIKNDIGKYSEDGFSVVLINELVACGRSLNGL
jgi:hypothetical protein